MRKQFYFAAMICVLLSAFLLSVDATDISNEGSLWMAQNQKYREATQKAIATVQARSLMDDMAVYYNLNAEAINKGKRMTLGSVLKGAATVTVTVVTRGRAARSVTVIASMEPALKALGLVDSINTQSDLESAYEAAISALQSHIWDTSAEIARYRTSWETYSLVLSSHNTTYHGSSSSPSDSAHEIDTFTPVTLNEGLPSFSCPDGSCGLTWTLPSSARMAHFAQCGTKDDPYDTWLKGCYEVFYTCNTTETARHKPNDCGLERWTQTTHGWSKVACGGHKRACTQNQSLHATVLGTNQISMCNPSDSSSSSSSNSNSQKSASLSGSSSASAGGSVSVSLTTSTAFSSVYWYVAGPSDSGLGTNVETDSGGSSSTSASLSYTFGSSDSGDYTITAYIYNYSDSSVYQTSHTVSVSGSSSYTPPSYTPSPPSTPSSSDDSCSSDCWYEDDACSVTCTKCGASYRICTSQWGDCAEGDGYHYSDYTWQ